MKELLNSDLDKHSQKTQRKRTDTYKYQKYTHDAYDADARPLLNILGLKTIQNLIETETNTMVFKALNGLAPEYLSKL